MSIKIKAFNLSEVEVLAQLSQQTFIESHGHSARQDDIKHYIAKHFNTNTLTEALINPKIQFNKVLIDNQLAGYSKLILNSSPPHTQLLSMAKFERLYLLKPYYGLGLGESLLTKNITLAKQHDQRGLWLFVWTENEKAYKFYLKNGFKIIGKHDFKISTNHSNPNFVMLKDL